MATKKKAKAKSKPKKTAAKSKAKKAPRRAALKKAKRPAKAAHKPKVAAPAEPPPGKRIGTVTHYFGEPSVAVVKLDAGSLRVGDTIHIRGHTTDFEQRVESLQVDHAPVNEVGPKDDFGMKVTGPVREHDVVYKVR